MSAMARSRSSPSTPVRFKASRIKRAIPTPAAPAPKITTLWRGHGMPVRREAAMTPATATAAGALVAEAEDALVVGHHDEPHVLEGRVAQHVVDPSAVVGRDPEAASPAEDVTELLARPAHGGRVDDGQEFLEMLDQHPVEERLVPVLQGREADVALERIRLPRDVAVGAPHLLLEGADGVGQQPLEAESAPLFAREGGALVVHGMAEELRAAVGDLQPGHAIGTRLEVVTLHGSACGIVAA